MAVERRPAPLAAPNEGEHVLYVSIHAHPGPEARDVPGPIDDERRPFDPHERLALALVSPVDAVLSRHTGVTVRQQRKREMLLGGVVPVRHEVVIRDAQHDDPGAVERGMMVAEVAGLVRAPK